LRTSASRQGESSNASAGTVAAPRHWAQEKRSSGSIAGRFAGQQGTAAATEGFERAGGFDYPIPQE